MRILWIAGLILFTGLVQAKEVKRIIALSPHAVEMLYAIGAGERIVGTVEYADFPESALKIERVGNYAGVQIERIVELKPDLIIAWKSGNKKADLDKLESLGLKIFYSAPTDINQISSEMLRLGQTIGVEPLAKAAAEQVASQYEKLKARYANQKKIKVFYQLWHDPMRTIGPNSWIGTFIRDCGGLNIFADAEAPYPVVSLETILIKDPQVIIVPHHSGSAGAKKEIWNKWPMVSAVKNQQINVLNGDLLHRFTPRAIDGMAQVCQAIDRARQITKVKSQ